MASVSGVSVVNNYEKYFGTPEKTAETFARPKRMDDSFSSWCDGDGALLVALVPPSNVRSATRTEAIANCYLAWLQEECE